MAAPICRRMRTLQRDAADLISTVSAAVRARDRSHVSRQCKRREKNRPNIEEIRERSGDRLSGLALKEVRARELWPDIEDVGLVFKTTAIDHSAIPPQRHSGGNLPSTQGLHANQPPCVTESVAIGTPRDVA